MGYYWGILLCFSIQKMVLRRLSALSWPCSPRTSGGPGERCSWTGQRLYSIRFEARTYISEDWDWNPSFFHTYNKFSYFLASVGCPSDARTCAMGGPASASPSNRIALCRSCTRRVLLPHAPCYLPLTVPLLTAIEIAAAPDLFALRPCSAE